MELFQNSHMRIIFVLPGYTRQPIGGFQMVYMYANEFQKRGYEVILYCVNQEVMKKYPIPRFLKKRLINYLTQREPRWYPLSRDIKKYSGIDNKTDLVSLDSDVVIATSVDSVSITNKLFNNQKKLYFIQDFENWKVGDDYCYKTYNAGMKNIVISSWLQNIVDGHSGSKSIIIKNPIDLTVYKPMIDPMQRDPFSVGMLFHNMPHKGCTYAIDALLKLKKTYPKLKVYMFGVPERPKTLPDWFSYTHCASTEETVEIYNKVSIWLCATIDEGYGLTGLEAMACGDALVSTDYSGVHEYAEDGYNALLSPVRNSDALVANMSRIIGNPKLKETLIRNGLKSVQDFSIEKAVKKFEYEILN